MTVYVFDTFTDADGTALDSHTPDVGGAWSNASGWEILGDSLVLGVFTPASVPTNATPAGSANFDVSLDIVMQAAAPGNDFLGVIARGAPDSGDFYAAYYENGYTRPGGLVYLSAFVGDAETILGTFELPYVQGETHTITLRMAGSTISALVDGFAHVSVTDTTYPAGTAFGMVGAVGYPQSLAGANFLAQTTPMGADQYHPTCPTCGALMAPYVGTPDGAPWLCTFDGLGYWVSQLRGGDLGAEMAAALVEQTSVRVDMVPFLSLAQLTALSGSLPAGDVLDAVNTQIANWSA